MASTAANTATQKAQEAVEAAESIEQSDWSETDTDSNAFIKNKPTLSTVATTGSYNDLVNKPTLSTVATSGSYNDLANKPTLSTVARTGSYNDLVNKPSVVLSTNTQWATGACMPDYSAGVSKVINTIYTASKDCFVSIYLLYSNTAAGLGLYVYDSNNNQLLVVSNTGPNTSASASWVGIFIPKGYKYKGTATFTSATMLEFPLKGAN